MPVRAAGDVVLEVAPDRGGGVTDFTWRGMDVFRRARPGDPRALSCFPLVPFSNRIAHGRFAFDGARYAIAPNMPGGGHPDPLHGFGWLAACRLADRTRPR